MVYLSKHIYLEGRKKENSFICLVHLLNAVTTRTRLGQSQEAGTQSEFHTGKQGSKYLIHHLLLPSVCMSKQEAGTVCGVGTQTQVL